MYIETKRLIIRDFNEADADVLYRIKTDKQVLEYAPDLLEVEHKPEDTVKFIRHFNQLEKENNTDTWRCYAIEHRETKTVVGCLCFDKYQFLFEYALGWMMLEEYTGNGYAAEAAEAFSEYFCEKYGVDYLIAIIDVDNPASYHTALKAGFKLFEKRTVYDYSCNRYCDDYYYFRRYFSKCTLEAKFYGDIPYEGRVVKDGKEEK